MRTDHGQSDTGVAAGRFNNGLTRLQRTTAFCRFDDVDGKPVLHRARRICRFEFDVHLDTRRCEIVDANSWCVANRIQHAVKKTAIAFSCTHSFTGHDFTPSLQTNDPRQGHPDIRCNGPFLTHTMR